MKAYQYLAEGLSDARNEDYNKCYAFASKYCSWHKPDKFPIMDSCAKKNLYYFIVNNDIPLSVDSKESNRLKDAGFHEYELFWILCGDFKKFIQNKFPREKEYTFKEIDKLLWQYGRNPQSDSYQSKEMIEEKEEGGII